MAILDELSTTLLLDANRYIFYIHTFLCTIASKIDVTSKGVRRILTTHLIINKRIEFILSIIETILLLISTNKRIKFILCFELIAWNKSQWISEHILNLINNKKIFVDITVFFSNLCCKECVFELNFRKLFLLLQYNKLI